MRHSGGTRQNYDRRKEAKSCSLFRILVVVLVSSWTAFVFFCLKYGYFSTSPYVDSIKNVTGALRGNIENMKFHIPRISYTESKSIAPSITTDESNIHVIFSTDCGSYQDWQTLVMFHSAKAVGQKGHITRIASGCNAEQKEILIKLYEKLYPQNHVHFTPDFKKDEKSKKSYDFYNKPWGVKHWLEFAEPKIEDGVIIILVDPDMIFLRPITAKVRGEKNLLYNKVAHGEEENLMERVSLGHAAGQMYGLGAPWARDYHKKFNKTRICGVGSPCTTDTEAFGDEHYSVGPPYVLVKEDMLRLTETWTQFVPRVFENYPYLLAEMYAYSMAASHERLPHFSPHSYMVSEPDGRDEGWPWIDQIEDVCEPPVNGIYHPESPLPNVMHYCQTYRVGDIGFAKRQVPHNIFGCSHAMFVDPPRNIIHSTTRFKDGEVLPLKPSLVKRNAFSVCVIHRSINAAILDYKERMCNENEINRDKTYIVLVNG